MKYFILLFVFLPLSSSASVLLANCDHKDYSIIIRNGGSERIALLKAHSGSIEEFGPILSFQIKEETGTAPVLTITEPDAEFCIWSGRITLQRMNRFNNSNGG